MANPMTVAKTQAISLALNSIVGSSPTVEYTDTYGKISFTPDQVSKLQSMMQSTGSEADDVQIDFLPVILPVLVKKALPYVLGLLALGIIIGRKSKRSRR